MRIAVFHELHAGGARRAANELSRQLKKKHTVDLFTTVTDLDKNEKSNFSSVNVNKLYIKKWNGKNWKVRIYKDSIELFNIRRIHKKIAKDINDKNYDVVILHPSRLTQAPFLLKFIKTRRAYYCQEPLRVSYESEILQESAPDIFRAFYRKITDFLKIQIDLENVKSADVILANSRFTQKNIKKVYGRKSSLCYLGVDTTLFIPRKTRKVYDLLFIGNETKVEGYSLLQGVINILGPKTTLYLLMFKNKWSITDEKLREIYNSSKVTLSLAVNEPFGLIPLESMACGTPVIAVNEGGYRETVKHEKTGILVERNPVKVSMAVNSLLYSQKLREDYGKSGRENVVKNWTWEKSGKRLEYLLMKIVK